ncbi:hypothetical protein ACFLWE_00140 [Chloroflexota bacterium]
MVQPNRADALGQNAARRAALSDAEKRLPVKHKLPVGGDWSVAKCSKDEAESQWEVDVRYTHNDADKTSVWIFTYHLAEDMTLQPGTPALIERRDMGSSLKTGTIIQGDYIVDSVKVQKGTGDAPRKTPPVTPAEPPEQVSKFQLTIETIPSEGGSVFPSGGAFTQGDTVRLEAKPNPGFVFSGWDGSAVPTGQNQNELLKLTFDSDVLLKVLFERKKFKLTTRVEPSGSGTVNHRDGTFSYGEKIFLEAVPAPGFTFYSWTGDINETLTNVATTIYSDRQVTANFALPHSQEGTGSPEEDTSQLILSNILVCCSEKDNRAGKLIADKFSLPLMSPISEKRLTASDDDLLIVSTGGKDNKFKQAFGQVINPSDLRHTCIFHKSIFINGAERDVWGIGGWDELDTLMAARRVVENGLPSTNERQAWVVIQCPPPCTG